MAEETTGNGGGWILSIQTAGKFTPPPHVLYEAYDECLAAGYKAAQDVDMAITISCNPKPEGSD